MWMQKEINDGSYGNYSTEGYSLTSSGKLPTRNDMLYLSALMEMSEANDWNPIVVTTKYELLSASSGNCGGDEYKRLCESLNRWQSVYMAFKESYEGIML